ncbi:hypothetical protein AJ79_07971 [Helicocarpus griseus UAMH5409]|uniref:RNA polymerase II holoenzyme cyclin-like subunit n=1 Tax=Helicocarpus griseus UAMH5409 TaxID=1447875 RepID=A0A2B7WXC4_9EURO|nr:hypothetical protein AJ79_07971 [Helicocarpus griseus UAMH5409]
MPTTASSARQSVPLPSNPVLVATQSQWIFTDAELYRTPSILDGMTIEAEHTSRSKGVNFITQVGMLLKLPQLTLCTASVYLHRFFMRYSMKDLPHRPGMHPYSIAATALFLATKVEENCRKMKELIVACCRVAQKKPSMIVDEQSKDFWRWRDTILHNEDLLLEALCFDLQLEQPYRLLYEFICYFGVRENKQLRNSAWAFLNDSTYTVLCVQFHARTIAAAALYAAARHCEVTFEDDKYGNPWWEQLGVDLGEMKRACNRIADIYEFVSVPVPGQQYVHLSTREDEATDTTRAAHQPKSESSMDISANSMSPGEINGRKRERDSHSGSFSQHPISIPPNGAASGPQDSQPSAKRQRREGSDADTEPNSSFNRSQTLSSQPSFVHAASNLNITSNPSSQTATSNPSSQGQPDMNGHPRHISPPKSRIPQEARIPPNPPRREHPLPPPPPVTVPPLPHQEEPPLRRGSYGNHPPPPPPPPLPQHKPPLPRGPPPPIGASTFHPPPPPSQSHPANVDELQQRIDAIIQQGLPPENDRPQERDSYRPVSRDRDWDRDRRRHRDMDGNRDRDRERDRDRDRHRDRDRERERDWGRDRERERDRDRDADRGGRDYDRDYDRDYKRSRRRSSETSGSVAMSTSLSAASIPGAPPPASHPPAPHPPAPSETSRDQDQRPEPIAADTAPPQEKNNSDEAGDGGGSEEGEV